MKSANFLPTREQELLLSAALSGGREAIDAWRQWLTLSEGTELDVGSQCLTPQVYANLTRLGVREPALGRFKGFYRQTWYLNHQLLHGLGSVLRACEDEGIPTMVVKGVPLTLQIYRDIGLRPMNDIDLAVQPADAGRAVALLSRLGWHPVVTQELIEPSRHVAYNFWSTAGFALDLHFSLFHESLDWRDTQPIWHRAQPLRVGDASTLAPCATDQLLHTITHGARSNPLPPIRWVADAARLMRDERPVDWDALLDSAESLRLMLVMQQVLPYLSVRFGGIPAKILEVVSSHRPSRLERLEFHISRVRRVPYLGLVNYLRLSADRGQRPGIISFLRFFQDRWQVRSLPETFARLVRNVIVSLRR